MRFYFIIHSESSAILYRYYNTKKEIQRLILVCWTIVILTRFSLRIAIDEKVTIFSLL